MKTNMNDWVAVITVRDENGKALYVIEENDNGDRRMVYPDGKITDIKN